MGCHSLLQRILRSRDQTWSQACSLPFELPGMPLPNGLHPFRPFSPTGSRPLVASRPFLFPSSDLGLPCSLSSHPFGCLNCLDIPPSSPNLRTHLLVSVSGRLLKLCGRGMVHGEVQGLMLWLLGLLAGPCRTTPGFGSRGLSLEPRLGASAEL